MIGPKCPTTSTRRAMRRTAVAGVALVLAVPAGSAFAAKPFENVHERSTTTEILTDFCGVTGLVVDVTETVDEHRIFIGRGNDGLYYFQAGFHEVQTFLNRTTGRTMTIDRRVLDRDARATFNADGTVTLLLATTGVSKVFDGNGDLWLMDTGRVSYEQLLDANLQFIEFIRVVKDAGRNDLVDRDFCNDFLAATS